MQNDWAYMHVSEGLRVRFWKGGLRDTWPVKLTEHFPTRLYFLPFSVTA